MILAAVVCPHPPLLLRELSGAQDAVPDLRRACHAGLEAALALEPDRVLVLGGGPISAPWDSSLPVDVRSFGTTDAPAVHALPTDVPSLSRRGPDATLARALPHSLGVGRRLLDETGWAGETRMRTIAWAAPPDDLGLTAGGLLDQRSRSVLLVLADGSARRGEKAPGYLDERAFAFDDAIAGALADGDPVALARLDRAAAEELMVLGWSSLVVLGEAVHRQGGPVEARTLYRDDPYGVAYNVALWKVGAAELTED